MSGLYIGWRRLSPLWSLSSPSDLTPIAQDFILSKLAVNKKVLAINMAIQLVVYRSLKLEQNQSLLDEQKDLVVFGALDR